MIFSALRQPLDSSQVLRTLLLICAVLVFNVFDSQHRFSAALKNWGHVAVFFLASHLLLDVLRPWLGQQRRRLTGMVLFCLAVGASIEVFQPLFGRDRSLLDLAYDAIGIAAALLFYLANEKQAKGLRGLGCIVLILSTLQPVYFGVMLLAQSWAVPYLAGFEQFWEEDNWRAGEHTQIQVVPNPSGGHWLRVDMSGGTYPGLSFHELHHDWRGYNALALRIFSSQAETLSLAIRIHDSKHNNVYNDRFNQRFSIRPGINDLIINLHDVAQAPKNRRMDLTQIQSLSLFGLSPQQPITIYIDDVRLLE